MCGIVGYVNFDGSEVPLELIKKATDELEHRGPDGEGQWVFGNVGLGHRRLSIIDLSELGSQPMLSLDGNFVISYKIHPVRDAFCCTKTKWPFESK